MPAPYWMRPPVTAKITTTIRNVKPRNLYGCSRGDRHSCHAPYTNNTAPSTPHICTARGMKVAGPNNMLVWPRITAPIAACGHPCWLCQISIGIADSATATALNHRVGRRSNSLGPKHPTAISVAIQKIGISHFTCSAAIVTSPATSSNPSRRVRTQRTTSHDSSAHIAVSMMLVVNVPASPNMPNAVLQATAARTCALRPPPNSRAMSALTVTTTRTAMIP